MIDFHKETTSEGYGLAHFLDGRVSFVFGTHTHIQTNDELILPG
jgi:calcineurin-like phosphoesterase